METFSLVNTDLLLIFNYSMMMTYSFGPPFLLLVVIWFFGGFQMWDAGTGQGFSHYREHQKRAWSVDFSLADPMMFASGSDDCSVKLWSLNEACYFLYNLILALILCN